MTGEVSSMRAAANLLGVSAGVVQRWRASGLLGDPPWTVEQLTELRDATAHPGRKGRVLVHGTATATAAGCTCEECRAAERARKQRRRDARKRAEVGATPRRALLAVLDAGRSFDEACSAAGLTARQVWSAARVDPEWGRQLDGVLTRTRRTDAAHGIDVTYRRGCRCPDCRQGWRIALGRDDEADDDAPPAARTETAARGQRVAGEQDA